MSERSDEVGCLFYVRTPAPGGGWYYDPVSVQGWNMDGALHTIHPPMVGDLFTLPGHPTVVVVARSWLYSSWGSTNWPYTEPRSPVGPSLTLIVEAATGLFVDEALRPDDDALIADWCSCTHDASTTGGLCDTCGLPAPITEGTGQAPSSRLEDGHTRSAAHNTEGET